MIRPFGSDARVNTTCAARLDRDALVEAVARGFPVLDRVARYADLTKTDADDPAFIAP